MGRADSLKMTPVLGKIEGKRRRGQQSTRWLDGITDSMDISAPNGHESDHTPEVSEGQGSLVCCSPCGRKELDATERLNNKMNLTLENQIW